MFRVGKLEGQRFGAEEDEDGVSLSSPEGDMKRVDEELSGVFGVADQTMVLVGSL